MSAGYKPSTRGSLRKIAYGCQENRGEKNLQQEVLFVVGCRRVGVFFSGITVYVK